MKQISRRANRYSFLRGNFLILMISWILMNFAGPIPQTYQSLYFKGLGATDFLLGVIGFAGSIALALVQFPGGYLADKHGRRLLVVTMTYGLALSYVFFVLAPSWQFIVLALIVQNFCLLYQPAMFAMMLDSVPPEERGKGYTLQAVVSNLVSLPAAIIAGYLILIFNLDLGMRIAYLIALLAYLAAATFRINLKETLPQNKDKNSLNFLAAIREYPTSVKEGLQVWSRIPKAVLYLFVATIGITSLVAACQMFFVVYATSVLRIDNFQWAVVMAFMSVSVAIPAILAGFRMDVVGRKRYFILSFLLYIPAMLIFLNANFIMLLASFFLFGLAQMLLGTSFNSLLGDLTPRELRGTVIGCGQFFMYVGQAFAQLLAGALYTYVSPQLPFILLAASAFPLSIIAFLKISDPSAKEV
ncbi:MAG: MFS transporter [Candidatus Bathyarchaeia archaeon]|jgi:MFS family permease